MVKEGGNCMKSKILTPDLASRAVDIVVPAILMTMKTGLAKRSDLHLVIGDPAFLSRDDISYEEWVAMGIAYERSLSDPSHWEYPYQEIARRKAYLSWRYQMPTQHLQSSCPYLLTAGDTIYYGSYYSDGLPVAASGVEPYWDQMFASWTGESCRGLCIHAVQSGQLKLDVGKNFLV